MTDTITTTTATKIVRLILLVLVLLLVLIGYVFFQAYDNRVEVVDNQRRGCERGKLDRRDNARFQMAQAQYVHKVVLAQSVKNDVKKAARTAVKTFDKTSANLSKRSKIDCTKAFPDARIFP